MASNFRWPEVTGHCAPHHCVSHHRPNSRKAVCPLCLKTGHKTKVSKKCTHNPNNPEFDPNWKPPTVTRTVAAPQQPLLTAEQEDAILGVNDVDDMDGIPFADDLDTVEIKRDEFRDNSNWSDTEDNGRMEMGAL